MGRHNRDAGPDFTGARIRLFPVGESDNRAHATELVGNVEIHVESRDWYRHHHHEDAAYDSVILHVVRSADQPVYTSRGEALPQLPLVYDEGKDYVEKMLEEAREMDSALATHRCGTALLDDPNLLSEGWKRTMLLRRLQCKQESIEHLMHLTHNDLQQAFYVSLAHSFGFHVNGIPMEFLARQTPLSVLLKHRDSLLQVEAILLGQAGLIDSSEDLHQREYDFLKVKFGLESLDVSLWKMARLRPQNQPRVRIRQLAALIHGSEFLLTHCLEAENIKALHRLFACAGMGKSSVDVLLINVVVPFMYYLNRSEQALNLLEALPAEDNRIIRQWQLLGQRVTSAADSQALIHLYQTCCEEGHCLSCEVWSALPPSS